MHIFESNKNPKWPAQSLDLIPLDFFIGLYQTQSLNVYFDCLLHIDFYYFFLSRNQAIQNQRNSFSRGFPLPFNVETLNGIRGTFPDSAILSEIFVL
jgi:hypothetical protein